jgi:Tol biopolymer transport system component
MKPLAKITVLATLAAVAYGCEKEKLPLGPGAVAALRADVSADGAAKYGPWGAPVNLGAVVNSPYIEQHPAISKDGLSLYISSTRPGGYGGTDIWVSHRASIDDPWGTPENLGPNINSAGNDLAPSFTPDGHSMYFHSTGRGGCGLADLFVARRHDKRDDFGWEPAENLGCVVNSAFADAGPTYFEDETTGITTLYFTVQNNPPTSDQGYDIYASTRKGEEGEFGPPSLVTELSSPYRDTRTTIRRDGLEMIISSGRPGGVGSEDLWVSTRSSTLDPWGTPVNLGPVVNSSAFDGAPALSFDGTTLYFFSERLGGFGNRDLYVTRRARLHEPDVAEQAAGRK